VAEAEGIRITITDIIDPWDCWPEPGMRCVAFEVMGENVSDSPRFFVARRFTLTDTDRFQHQIHHDEPQPRLRTQELRPGTRTQGFIAFEIRELAVLGELYYEPGVVFRAQ